MREKIKEIAKEKQISINQLEIDTGLARGTIAHWNEVPKSIKTIKKVADALGVTVDELLPKAE